MEVVAGDLIAHEKPLDPSGHRCVNSLRDYRAQRPVPIRLQVAPQDHILEESLSVCVGAKILPVLINSIVARYPWLALQAPLRTTLRVQYGHPKGVAVFLCRAFGAG